MLEEKVAELERWRIDLEDRVKTRAEHVDETFDSKQHQIDTFKKNTGENFDQCADNQRVAVQRHLENQETFKQERGNGIQILKTWQLQQMIGISERRWHTMGLTKKERRINRWEPKFVLCGTPQIHKENNQNKGEKGNANNSLVIK